MLSSSEIKKTRLLQPFIMITITLVACLLVLLIYLHGPLQGNFNQFFMPAEKFGVPTQLREHGITALYKGMHETGWDGQFYYYIANDPLGLKDTTQHLDSSAYRYQRIGLPLLAKLISKITRELWVSPLTYYLTSLLVILAAVWVAAAFFQRKNRTPYLILLWALGCGTQVTQLNGLPDAAADGFLIIALISLIEKRALIYVAAMTFSALTREVYVILPFFIAMTILIQNIRMQKMNTFLMKKNIFTLFSLMWIHTVPMLVAIAWQIFIRIKFAIAPTAQMENILNWPLLTIFHYLFAGLRGMHPDWGMGRLAYLEGIGVLLYLALLVSSATTLFCLLTQSSRTHEQSTNEDEKPMITGIALGFLFLIGVYLCFGPVVMKHHTGYFKAANIFLFVLPFSACLTQKKLNKFVTLFLIVVTVFFDYLLWPRIAGPAPNQVEGLMTYAKTEPACLKNYRANIQVLSIEDSSISSVIKRFFVERMITINTKVSNTSTEVFSPFPGKGGVNVSYQWVKADNLDMVKDGNRTPLLAPLSPGQSTELPVRIHFPSESGKYILKLSLVQEGCGWFYVMNQASAFSIPYTIQ